MRIYTDASTRDSFSGIAFVATSNKDEEICKKGIVIRQSDNNTAELTAILFALRNINKIDKKAKHITILSDSEYAIGTIRTGICRQAEEKILFQIFKYLEKYNVNIFHVKGHCQDGTILSYFNKRADKMSKVVRKQYEKKIKEEKKKKLKELRGIKSKEY